MFPSGKLAIVILVYLIGFSQAHHLPRYDAGVQVEPEPQLEPVAEPEPTYFDYGSPIYSPENSSYVSPELNQQFQYQEQNTGFGWSSPESAQFVKEDDKINSSTESSTSTTTSNYTAYYIPVVTERSSFRSSGGCPPGVRCSGK